MDSVTENDKFELTNEINEIQLVKLDRMDLKIIEGTELDKTLIDERNADMKKLEAELSALVESIHLINEMVNQDGEKLEQIEETITQVDIQITGATKIVEEVVPLFQSIKEKYLALKIAGAGISCGMVFGGIGFFAGGPAGAAIGAPVGAGLGALGGWLTKFIP